MFREFTFDGSPTPPKPLGEEEKKQLEEPSPSNDDLRRSHSISLQPALVRREVWLGKHLQACGAVGQSAKPPPLHPCRRDEWQRLDVRDARKHLSRGGIACRAVH